LLRIALDATLQATSVIDCPAAVAWSGSYGRPLGTIAFDGRRSRDVANRDDRFGYPVGARGTTALAT